jgi:hypothetical protein
MKTMIALFANIGFFPSMLDFIIMDFFFDMENISTLDFLQKW